MKDIVVFMAVLIVGYFVSMGILYMAFRVFFPAIVEKRESLLKVHLNNGKTMMKVSQQEKTSRPPTELHKIKLAHG